MRSRPYIARSCGYPIAARSAEISSRIAGSSIVGGTYRPPVGDLLDRAAHDLPRRVFGSRLTDVAVLKTRPARSARAPARPAPRTNSSRVRRAPAFSTTRPSGTSPLSASATPTTAHSATSGCAASTSSIAPVRQPMPGDVDHVVGAAHDPEIAVLVLEPGVRGQVVAGIGAQIGVAVALRRCSIASAGSRAAAGA